MYVGGDGYMARISHVLEDAAARLLDLDNVVGVGRGYKCSGGLKTAQECVVVLVKKKLPEDALSTQALVPPALRGVPTDVVEVGELRFLADDVNRKGRVRPAQPGVSIGHGKITAGTFGAVVWDRRTGEPFILSCNHVLANATSGRDGRARRGDPILQPGAVDGGTPERDRIAALERFAPIEMSGKVPACLVSRSVERAMGGWLRLTGTAATVEVVTRPLPSLRRANSVDAALAKPANARAIDPEVLGLGRVSGVTEPSLGMEVRKSGRTTGVTEGEITVVDAVVRVVYAGNITATFRGQIVTTAMADGGDSGSLLVDRSARAVGLLFAGSDKSTLYNEISEVLEALDVSLEPVAA